MSFWSKALVILHPDGACGVARDQYKKIKLLILKRDAKSLNKLLKQGKIDLFTLASDIYNCNRSFEFLDELDIDSSDLIATAMKYERLNNRYKFIEQVTNINFEDLYQEALKSNDIEFISKVAVIGLKNQEAAHYVFDLARKIKDGPLAPAIYIFAENVLEVAKDYLDDQLYFELVDFLESSIIENGSSYFISKFAINIPDSNKNNLIEAFINSKKDNSNKESNNSKEENDATREIINLAIESNAMYIGTIIAQIIKTNNINLIINLAYCLILNNVDKDFIIDFTARLKEIKNTECMYKIIKELKNSANKELRDLLIDELIKAITDSKDLKHSALLTREYQTISLENLHKLFSVIMEAFEILDDSMDKVERILAKLVIFEVLDANSLKCFISYLNFKTTGALLPSVKHPTELGDDIIVGGIQYQLVKPDETSQIKGA